MGVSNVEVPGEMKSFNLAMTEIQLQALFHVYMCSYAPRKPNFIQIFHFSSPLEKMCLFNGHQNSSISKINT